MFFKKKAEKSSQGLFDESTVLEFDSEPRSKARRDKEKEPQSFEDLPQSEFVFKDPGINNYAERWGSASVNATRLFILALLGVASATVLGYHSLKTATEQKAQPILVEFNGATGEYRKPVKIESMTATDAMAKFALGKWAEWVFTVDPKLSYNYLLDADAMSKGKAKGQFAEFRSKTDVVRQIKEAKKFVFAKTLSVDILQAGVAIVNLETKDIDKNGQVLDSSNYRVRLDYSINPPTNAAVVLRNPIGLEVEGFTYERLTK